MVLDMFRLQPLVEFLSLYDLTLRTVTLLALVSAQRYQTLHMLDLDYMVASDDSYSFTVHGDFKQSRLGHNVLHVNRIVVYALCIHYLFTLRGRKHYVVRPSFL